jgi:cytochrome c
MSALPPKADIHWSDWHVRFVPKAEVAVGPALNGLDGRKAGTVEGYDYSEVNKNSGILWSEATFKEYLIDPSAKIPGTKMIFSDENEQEG